MLYSIGIGRRWKKTELYVLYWVGYLVVFTLIEGSTEHDFLHVFRNELISLPPKAVFAILVIEVLFKEFERKRYARFIGSYILLVMVSAFFLRLIDNFIILQYFLRNWIKEPLLSAAPFLYNIIKLQFLLTVPFCYKLYRHLIQENSATQPVAFEHPQPEKTALLVKCERRMVNLLFEDICYFEAQGNYLQIVTVNGTFKTYLSISELEEKLPATKFVRVHRSFVVALNKVESHTSSQITIGTKNIPIGRSYAPAAKQFLLT